MTGENRDFILLGIKYESARIAGVSDDALEKIAEQILAEVGEGWESNPMVQRGRNAVRQEHDLDQIGVSGDEVATGTPPRRPRWWFFGRRA